MRRLSTPALILTVFFVLSGWALAMGGFGGGGAPDKSETENIKKLKLTPLDESSNAYGWVRITADTLALGANRLPADQVYTVYFVNGNEKKLLGEEGEEAVRTSDSGEVKFSVKLSEPLGAQWAKLVLYNHPDGNPESTKDLKPVMEAALR